VDVDEQDWRQSVEQELRELRADVKIVIAQMRELGQQVGLLLQQRDQME